MRRERDPEVLAAAVGSVRRVQRLEELIGEARDCRAVALARASRGGWSSGDVARATGANPGSLGLQSRVGLRLLEVTR